MALTKRKLSFDILDSIRGIAALYVTISHCRGSLWIGVNAFKEKYPVTTWDIGDYAMFSASMLTRLAVEFVIVFFVLSGFSIAHSLSEKKAALPFYKRRFIRIYPSYVVALAWAGLIFICTKQLFPEWYDGTENRNALYRTNQMNDFFHWDVLLKNLFYMPSEGFISPFWSLTYEVIFYLLAPFLMRRLNLYAAISLVFYLSGLMFPEFIASWKLHRYFYEFLFVYNIYFAAGAMLYSHYDKVMEWFSVMNRKLILLLIFLSLGVMYAANFYLRGDSPYSFLAAALLSFLLIFYFLKYQIRIRWLMNVGHFSYTLYITHLATVFVYFAIYWAIVKPQVPYILNYFMWMPAVFLCLLVAYLQYKLVESRSKAILSRLRSKQATETKPSE